MIFNLGPVHYAIVIALKAGPLPMLRLSRALAGSVTGDYGRQLADLTDGGWVRGPRGTYFEYELSDEGHALLADGASNER